MTKRTIKSCSIKTLAIFLSVLMIFYLIPAASYASLFEATDAESVVSEPAEYTGEIFEDISRREENVKHFRLEDGTYMAAQYDTAVHTLDGNGEWQDIDNTLSESGSEYSTSNARIKFTKKITGNESIFTLHENNRKITLSLDGAIKKTAGVATNTETEFDETATTLQKMMTLDKLSSRIIYEDILDGVDLEYIVVSNNVKENIIVKEQKDAYSYSFTLKLNNLSASLSSIGDIEITEPDSGEILYIIPAPVVYDANMVYASEDEAHYTLETIGQNEYRLTVAASTSWMNASDRAFPVVIDPAIYYGGYNMGQMCDTLVSQKYPSSVFGSRKYLKVGYDNANANLKAYVAMRSLPTLPAGSMITEAKLNLIYNGASEGNLAANPLTIVAKKIIRTGYTSLWTESSTTYNTAMTYGDILDYKIIAGSTAGNVEDWNITSAVVDWYADSASNQGVALMPYDMTDTTVHTVQFHSSDNSMTGAYTPFFTIAYVSAIGVEGYYSYQSASAGLAGTGYVNTATGALTFVKPLLSTTDSLMPYTVSMTYNSDFAGKAYQYPNAQTAYSTSYMPYGFKLNINETIIEKRYTNSSAGQSAYYILADSDGTEHCFLPVGDSTTEYQDEDGLQLTLTISSSTCTIVDDSKIVKTFTKMTSTPASDVYSAWYLTSIKDKNNNTVSFSFDDTLRPTGVNLTPNGSSTISFLTLVYNSDGHLSMIRNDTSKEAIVFRYSNTYSGSTVTSSTKYLREIVYAHGNSAVTPTNWTSFYNSAGNTADIMVDANATYTYDSNGRLYRATDTLSGYRIEYTYTSGKVTDIQEYGRQGTQTEYISGQSATLTYGVYNTIIQTSGSDDVYGTADDLLTTYNFDTFARTANCYTTNLSRTQIYSASSGQYVEEENLNAKNSLKTAVQSTYASSNYLLNGSFEKPLGSSNWSKVGNTTIREGSYSRSGIGSLEMKVSSSATLASITQPVRLSSGDYSLSVYATSTLAANCDMKMIVKDGNLNVVASKNISLTKGDSIGNFALSELGFSIGSNAAANYTVTIELTSTSPQETIVCLDDVMLSKSLGTTEFDLVQNGNFEITASSGNLETYWSLAADNTDMSSDDNSFAGTPFGRVMAIDGVLGQANIVLQNIYQNNNINTPNDGEGTLPYVEDQQLFTLSGWAKGTDQCYSETSNFAIGIEILYYDGSDEPQRDYYSFDFVNNITDWQFVSGGLSTDPSKGIVESITIYLYYSGHPGTAYFDGITLIQNSATTSAFAYNSNGDISSYQNGSNKTWYAYDNNNISIVVTSNGNIVEYTYDSQNRVRTEQHSKCSEKINSPNLINSSIVTALYRYYYEYDNYGNRIYSRITDLSGSGKYSDSLTVFNTDSGSHIFGSVAEEMDALNNSTYYFYDQSNGRLMATIYPNGEGVAYEYDAVGRLINAVPAYVNEDSTDEYFTRTNAESVTYNYNLTTKQLEEIITATTTYTFIPDAFGNTEQINAGDYKLASYEYNPNNGKLNKLEYGNGFIIEYLYDALDRVSEIRYNIDGSEDCITAFSYSYDTAGNLSSIEDHVNNEVTVFNYDGAGKLMSSCIYDSETYVNFFETVAYYDDQSRASFVLQSFNNATSSGIFTDILGYSYEYHTNTNFISRFDIYGDYITLSVTPTYDNLGKTTKREITAKIGNDQAFYSEIYYTYKTSGQRESALVSQYASRVELDDMGLTTTTYNYIYDDNGNITEIRNSADETLYKYTYDYLGQLIREDNVPLNESYVFEYDNAGNILTKKTYSYSTEAELSSVSYSYNDSSWGDLLTNFNGTSITYDAIGNPTAIGYLDLAWEGRKLSSITRDGFFTIDYGYNADGIRVYKEYSDWDVDETTRHEYLLNGTQIVKETVCVDSVESYTLVYLYDETGAPIGIKYRTPSYAADVYDAFFFEKNLQGDIIAIYNETGVKIGTYTYDAWGNFTVTVSSGITILEKLIVRVYNPFRYRGYYYDTETGFYYVSSRYYDPEICRWINADDIAYLGTGGLTSYNLFAYCGNNPVMGYDPYGTFDFWGFAKGVGRIVTGIAAVAAGVAVCVAGAPVAMIAVAAVTITAGVLTAVNGAADIQQSVTGNNFVRDTVFNGNQTAYDVYSGVTETVAAVGTAVCGNYLSTNCTMKGAVPGTEGKVTLEPGTTLDRYGSQYGRYLTDPGTSINQLALTPGNSCNLTTYVVNRPFTFRTGVVAPCAWGPGGGVQYFSWMSVQRLVQFGFLTPIG